MNLAVFCNLTHPRVAMSVRPRVFDAFRFGLALPLAIGLVGTSFISAFAADAKAKQAKAIASNLVEANQWTQQMNLAASKGYFPSAARSARRVYDLRLRCPSPNVAMVHRSAADLIDLMVADGNLDDARVFIMQCIDDLRARNATEEQIVSMEQSLHAIGVLQQNRFSADKSMSIRYSALLRSVWMDYAADDLGVPDDDPSRTGKVGFREPPRLEMLSLETKHLGADHGWTLNSVISLGYEALEVDRVIEAEQLANLYEMGPSKTLPMLATGHHRQLQGEIAVAREDKKAAIQAYRRAAENYGSQWPLDAAECWSVAGVMLHDDERYEEALSCFDRALGLFASQCDYRAATDTNYWLTRCLHFTDDMDQAESTALEALGVARLLQDHDLIGRLALEAAWIAETNDETRDMVAHYKASIEAFEAAGDLESAATACNHLADSFDLIDDADAARAARSRANELAVPTNGSK